MTKAPARPYPYYSPKSSPLPQRGPPGYAPQAHEVSNGDLLRKELRFRALLDRSRTRLSLSVV